MDLLPRIGGVDHYQGGAQQRPGTGAFARKKRQEDERKRGAATDDESAAAELGVDPFLAEIDRLRALDPDLTESGAHRALMAVRAYQRTPGELPQSLIDDASLPAIDAAADVETADDEPPETSPGATTGSDGLGS